MESMRGPVPERGMGAEMQTTLKRIAQRELGGRRQPEIFQNYCLYVRKNMAWRGTENEEHVLWGKANENSLSGAREATLMFE